MKTLYFEVQLYCLSSEKKNHKFDWDIEQLRNFALDSRVQNFYRVRLGIFELH